MINRKNIIAIAILAGLSLANTSFANDLTQMDIKKSGASDTVDVTLYTTSPTGNSIVSRKNANRYVILLPNTNSSSSIVPSLGGVKDLISNVDVKHVNDGIGGYTKVTFETIKPINFKTYSKKSTAVASTTNYKPIIAASNAAKPVTVQPTKTTVPAPVKATTKPVAKTTTNTTNKKAAETVKPTTPKVENKQTKTTSTPSIVNVVKQKIQPITKTTSNNVKPQTTKTKDVKPVVTPQPVSLPKIVKTNTNHTIDLEPKVNHTIVKSNFYKNDNVEQNNPTTQPITNTTPNTTKPTKQTSAPVNNQQTPNKSNNGIIPIALAALLGGFILYRKRKANKNNIPVSVTNKLDSNTKGAYSQIVDNIELNWQEKFKLYSKSSNNIVKKIADKGNVTYVADVKNKNAKLTHVVKVDKKISELAIKKMPTIDNKINNIDISKMINKNIELPKLKSFANPMNLNDNVTTRLENNSIAHKELSQTERLPKLKASLNNALRKSTKFKETYDNKLLTIGKDRGEYMSKEEQKYVLSSLNEYLSILDKNASESHTTKNVSANAGMSNPIASSKTTSNPFKGMIVKSGYCINESKGFYLVNMNGTSALIGKNGNDTYVLKKFNSTIDSELQVRPDGMDVYMVKAGRYKCLVDVSKNKMGTLIEI